MLFAHLKRLDRDSQIDFASASITLRPTREELVSPEIAMLTGFKDGREMLWILGENSFEYLR